MCRMRDDIPNISQLGGLISLTRTFSEVWNGLKVCTLEKVKINRTTPFPLIRLGFMRPSWETPHRTGPSTPEDRISHILDTPGGIETVERLESGP